MPPLNGWDRSVYPENTDDVDVPDDMRKLLASVSGRTVQAFASVAARDAAFAELTTSTQRVGALAYVANLGLFYYTGTAWRRVANDGDMAIQSGQAGGVTDSNGVYRVNFSPYFGGVPVVAVSHTVSLIQPFMHEVRLFVAPGYLQADRFHVQVTDTANQVPYANQFISFSWIAHGPRSADQS